MKALVLGITVVLLALQLSWFVFARESFFAYGLLTTEKS